MRSAFRQIWRALAALAALYGLFALAVALVEDRLIFPAPAPAPVEEGLLTMLPLEGGGTAAAVALPNPRARHWVLFLHGNGEDLGRLVPWLRLYRQRGWSVLAVDYPGYGLSAGPPTEAGCYRAAEAAYAHLTGPLGVAPERVVVHGRSLGSGPALWLAARHRFAGLVLEAPLLSIHRVVLPFPLLPWDKFPNEARAPLARMPALVMHCEDDDVVPFAHGQRLHELLPGPKRLQTWPGGGHFPTQHGEAYWRAIAEFAAGL